MKGNLREPGDPIGSIERSTMEATCEGRPERGAEPRSGVGPFRSTNEASEGNEGVEGREWPEGNQSGEAKGRTQSRVALPLNLWRVYAAARRNEQAQFTALMHHADVVALERAFRRLRRKASAGVDGETVETYEQNLLGNHNGRYRPQPVRRVYIPKSDGGQRPLGVPALEDKVVQGAVAEVLSAVYEVDFLGFSYGFRPGRNPHQAPAAGQCLSTYVLDLWVHHHWRRRKARGRVIIMRYADDFVMGFQYADDARGMLHDPGERMMKFGLKLHEEKTRLIEFGRLLTLDHARRGERRPKTFAFLGFTHYCGRTRDGRFVVKRKTQSKRLTVKLKALRVEARRRMHAPVPERHRWVCQLLRGHYAYYGLSANFRCLKSYLEQVRRIWCCALRRRSQRRMTWGAFGQLLERFPLPTPRITHPCAT